MRRLAPAAVALLALCGGRADANDAPRGEGPVDETSWRGGDGRLRALYRPRFVPAAELMAEAGAFGPLGVDLALDGLRGRLVLTGADAAMAPAREALDWLDAPKPEVLVKVSIVETARRCRSQAGGNFLFDRDHLAGAPDTFFRGIRTAFEPEEWLRSELVGEPFQGSTLAFGRSSADGPFAGTIEQALRLLAHQGQAEFLAEPNLVCTQDVPSSIEASVLLPVPVQKRDENGLAITFTGEEVGVRLEVVVDRVSVDSVTLRLHPWVRQVVAAGPEQGIVGTPVLAVREVDTRLTIGDGETMVVGGLEHLRRARARDALPGFGGLPELPGLTSATAREAEFSEVLFVVSVRILTPGRAHGGTIPPGEAERLLHRRTRARVLPR